MMFVPLFTRGGSNKFLALALLITRLLLLSHQATATSCQVYPSEYAYRDDSVTRTESVSANCRRYPAGTLPGGVDPEHYIHCDGTQLKLMDSNFGQEQYQPTDYYVWSSSSSGEQMLFIFPTRVFLTTITLHYYSDSIRGLPRLTFYAVPDDFDVWDAPKTSYPRVDVTSVSPGGEQPDRSSVSINVNFNTKKVLMYKFSSTFTLSVSEVEFFTMSCTPIDTEAILTTSQPTMAATPTSYETTIGSPDFTEATLGTTVSSMTSGSPRCREIVAWVLVVMMQAII